MASSAVRTSSCSAHFVRTAMRITLSFVDSQSLRSGRERSRPSSAARPGVDAARISSACDVAANFCAWNRLASRPLDTIDDDRVGREVREAAEWLFDAIEAHRCLHAAHRRTARWDGKSLARNGVRWPNERRTLSARSAAHLHRSSCFVASATSAREPPRLGGGSALACTPG